MLKIYEHVGARCRTRSSTRGLCRDPRGYAEFKSQLEEVRQERRRRHLRVQCRLREPKARTVLHSMIDAYSFDLFPPQ
jgi:hypothetical protein